MNKSVSKQKPLFDFSLLNGEKNSKKYVHYLCEDEDE